MLASLFFYPQPACRVAFCETVEAGLVLPLLLGYAILVSVLLVFWLKEKL